MGVYSHRRDPLGPRRTSCAPPGGQSGSIGQRRDPGGGPHPFGPDMKKEYCGLFGVWGSDHAADETYLGLYALQHRGQESAGMAAVSGKRIVHHRGMGLVSQLFPEEVLRRLRSRAVIGHTRYSTTGSSDLSNAQPLVAEAATTPIAMAHNGNLVNSRELRKQEFEASGQVLPAVLFHTTTDTELMLLLVARHFRQGMIAALRRGLARVRGAFSLLVLTPDGLWGVRDPNGFRPLVVGKRGDAFAIASETCALDAAGYTLEHEVEPGEIVHVHEGGMQRERLLPRRACVPSFCSFEFVYFARPDSEFAGDMVQEIRRRLGIRLAQEHPVEADLVTPIPDSGNAAAEGFAQQAGIPYRLAFVRNHYTGRTFIMPHSEQREAMVRMKLSVIRKVVAGRRVVVVDDSIVRGTTVRSRVRLLREAGAKEVHLRISCPPIRYPCLYGIDFPTSAELIANGRGEEEIRRFIGADSLGYLSREGMLSCFPPPPGQYCHACWSGSYPVPPVDPPAKLKFEESAKCP